MAQPAYIKIEGVTQGLISNKVSIETINKRYQVEHEDGRIKQEISDIATAPIDTQSKYIQRAHKPFVFTYFLNKAMPLLYALTKDERLNSIETHWFRISMSDNTKHYLQQSLKILLSQIFILLCLMCKIETIMIKQNSLKFL